jgi:hypothetical protein
MRENSVCLTTPSAIVSRRRASHPTVSLLPGARGGGLRRRLPSAARLRGCAPWVTSTSAYRWTVLWAGCLVRCVVRVPYRARTAWTISWHAGTRLNVRSSSCVYSIQEPDQRRPFPIVLLNINISIPTYMVTFLRARPVGAFVGALVNAANTGCQAGLAHEKDLRG